ncbi:phosphotransferase family enzyme [Kribbella amoyensis]|uniref:Phosphotransferase family enzyme n=2 Tax=Kribbella amoyensis TaxID=996641 RepID=A0A561B3H0_9ACTN|nr:phosphotransferase family enzyme [Kribbella amoyensis]
MVDPEGSDPRGPVTVSIPEKVWFPDVEDPLRALREQLGIDGYVLTCLADEPGRVSYLLVSDQPVPGQDLTEDSTLKLAGEHLALPVGHPVTPAWTRPGWYAEALPWLDEQLAVAGTRRTGIPTQVRTWGLSNVLRCPTEAGDVYFKAQAHTSTVVPIRPDAPALLFAHEPRVLHALSSKLPEFVVTPLAIDEDRAWMVLPDLGTALADSDDVELWLAAVRGHARLQRAFVGRADTLLEYACVDRRLELLTGELDRLFGPNLLTDRLDPGDRDKLREAAGRFGTAIQELAAIGVPETLLHGDLHPRNVAIRDGRALAFDWTDAAVSHPFLDLVTFFEQATAVTSDPATAELLRDAYLAEWSEYAGVDDLRRAVELAGQVGILHQTMTYLHLSEHLSGPSRRSMLGGGDYWLKRLLAT